MLDPRQTDAVAGVIVATGRLFTVTTTEAVPLQPTPLLTVTLYVVVAAGATNIDWVVLPLLHWYEVPCDTTSVVALPIQILTAAGVITGTKVLFTLTVADAEALQLLPAVTVKV